MTNQIKNFIEEGEKERTDSELAIFWNEIATYLPKSYERSALGDEKIFIAFKQAYPQLKKHIQISLIKIIVEHYESKIPHYATGECEPTATDKEIEDMKHWSNGWNACRERFILDNISSKLKDLTDGK